MESDQYVREYWCDSSLCDSIIEYFKYADKFGETEDGGSSEGVDYSIKKSTEVSFRNVWEGMFGDDIWKLHDYVDVIAGFTSDYFKHFDLPGNYGLKDLPQVQYYRPNEGYFAPHIDVCPTEMDRVLVYITYLNDVPDGGTILTNNDMTITAVKGKTVFFPAGITHKHVGQISKKHEKYICTGWVKMV